jgi:hypothetical protein
MNETPVETLFHYLSKAVIIIPISIIIAVIIVKYVPDHTPKPQVNGYSIIPTATKAPSPSPSIRIDLKGPLLCDIQDTSASISAQIKDTQVKAQIISGKTTTYYVLKNDCLYQWEKLKRTGNKVCNLGPAISMVNMVGSYALSDNSLSNSAIAKSAESFTSLSTSSASLLSLQNFKKIVQSCKKGEIDDKIFTVPTNIVFTEATKKK